MNNKNNQSVWFALTLLLLSGCATTEFGDLADSQRDLKQQIQAVPFEQQTKIYSCGAAALASMLRYWQLDLSEAQVLSDYPPNDLENGYSLGELKAISNFVNLTAFAIRGDEKILKSEVAKNRPVMVALKVPLKTVSPIGPIGFLLSEILDDRPDSYNHFVVVIGFDEDIFRIMDPSRGLIDIERKIFLEFWAHLDNASLVMAKN